MPPVDFDAFSKQLKRGEIPGAVYLHGEEDILKDEIIQAIIDRVLEPGARDFNLDRRSASQLDPESIETLCTTLPMMAERRVVVVKDVETWGKRASAKSTMLRYLERPVPETVLILVQAAPRREDSRDQADADLARLACTVQVDAYPARLAEKWVAKRAEDRGIRLTAGAVAHLVRAVQGSLGAARSELDKLAGLGSTEPIDVETVAATLGIRRGETPDDWCDAVLQERTGAACEMLPHLLASPGVSGASLLSQLGTQLVGMGIARTHFDKGTRGGALERAVFGSLIRARPPRLDYRACSALWSRVISGWSLPRITEAVHAARKADRRLKSTTVSDERGILIDLLMEISPMVGAAA